MRLAGKLQQRWVLPLAVISFLLLLIIIEYQVLAYTKGVFAYPLDDAYIHMGIAKNIALHGVWGISKFDFVSASSSILYPLLLAAIFAFTGPNILIPFIVNVIAAIALMACMQVWLKRQGLTPVHQLIVLLAAIFIIPLPVIVSIGMEHILQILFCFLFIYKFSDWLAVGISKGHKSWILPANIYCYGVLVTATRYEGMFLIFIICLTLLYFRQYEQALQLGIITMSPIIIFGIISLYNGNYFFPNSVLLKSNSIPMNPEGLIKFLSKGIFSKLFYSLPSTSSVVEERLLIGLPLCYLIFLQHIRLDFTYKCMLIILMTTTFLHLVFANTTWFYRYEAYLLGSSTIVVGTLLAKYGKQLLNKRSTVTRSVALFTTCILFCPFIIRSTDAFGDVKGACQNIYDQNYNMGEFLHKYYDTTVVAINDLGCPSFLISGKIIDLWGLGNMDIARSKRNDYYGYPFLYALIKKEKVKIAVVFDRLYDPYLLQGWHKTATWHIDKIVTAGDPNLCFYAVDTAMEKELKKNLMAYQHLLSPGVTVTYSQN